MTMIINPHRAVHYLTERYGIELSVQTAEHHIDIRPSDLPVGRGFLIRVTLGWRRITAEFIPENFSRALINTMGQANQEKRDLFKSMVHHHMTNNLSLLILVNGHEIDPYLPELWPNHWNELSVRMTMHPVIPEEIGREHTGQFTVDLGGHLLGLIITLLQLEEDEMDDPVGLPEGAMTRVEVNRYERSTINRQACLLVHGCKCQACGFDFEEVYGLIGTGFIHVHHVVPVSELGPGYRINPATDLIPVCPNCHAMLHRRTPPYTISELRDILYHAQKSTKNDECAVNGG